MGSSPPILADGQRQAAHHVKQVSGPRTVQELRAHGNAARVVAGKLVDGHDTRVGNTSRAAQPGKSIGPMSANTSPGPGLSGWVRPPR